MEGSFTQPSPFSGSLVIYPLNLFLLDRRVDSLHLQKDDPRAIHLRKVLRAKTGDEIDLAVKNGPKGKATLCFSECNSVDLKIRWLKPHKPDYYPITLVVGVARPQTCRKILDQASALGVDSLVFFDAEKGEPSYSKSILWSSGEWEKKIKSGVEQAFASFVPSCSLCSSLKEALSLRNSDGETDLKIALDNYEAEGPLEIFSSKPKGRISVCVGTERGWSQKERQILLAHDYQLFDLGPRVLRVETAVVGCLTMLLSKFWPT